MSFGSSISSCFSKYARFAGRAQRSEFWWWVVFLVIVYTVTNLLDSLLGTRYYVFDSGSGSGVDVYSNGWITTVAWVLLLLPTISVAVRRLHDTGKSGWWWWLNVICCVGWIILLVFYLTDSEALANRYGPDPKGRGLAQDPPALA